MAVDDDVYSLHIYDRAYEEWGVGEPPDAANGTTFVALADGGAISLGGWDQGRSVQRLVPEGHEWSDAAPMAVARPIHRPRSSSPMGASSSPEERQPTDDLDGVVLPIETDDPRADRWSPGPDLIEPRKNALGVLLEDGSVLILGEDASFNTSGRTTALCSGLLTSVERLYLGTRRS